MKKRNEKIVKQDRVKRNYDQEGQVPEDRPEDTKKNVKKRKKLNRDIRLVTYLFVVLFLCLIGYFSYFIFVDSGKVINNSFNKRQEVLAKSVTRGMILSKDGEILAKTQTDSAGNDTRIYPYGSLFTHVVGRFSKGKTGLESSQSFTLLTSSTNPIKKAINEIKGEKSLGDNIVTTLDVDLQKLAANALGRHKGAVVVMEPTTGKILAMVSKPDYDPNKVESNWKNLISADNDDSSLLNRVTQGLYPPGSTYKIVSALQYMRSNNNYNAYSYTCTGTRKFGSVVINCHNKKHHGHLDFASAFAKSCNGAFVDMGTTFNLNNFKKTNEELLFNTKFNFDFNVSQSKYLLTSSSAENERLQTMMGQGRTLITPMHGAMIASAVANGGVLMKPYVVDHVENSDTSVVSSTSPSKYDTLMTVEEANVLSDLMKGVVRNGTASSLRGQSYTAAGKTGTAEYDSKGNSHAWFVGFAEKNNKKVAVSIIVEGAGTGTDYAVPIAKKIFTNYFRK